jgi:3-deoxy-D-manno-octulosonate 8-phosphate phosphatase (KDO 8-P phosphatase)
MRLPANELTARAADVRLLLFDVDGTLTDGNVLISSDGREAKSFWIRDGAAMIWAKQAGLGVGLLSGRASEATTRRATELGLSPVVQGGPDKRGLFATLLAEQGLTAAEVAYMGDDLLDLPILMQAGLSAAPADAAPEVVARVHWVSTAPAGRGAAREFIELVLAARQAWEPLLARHLVGG